MRGRLGLSLWQWCIAPIGVAAAIDAKPAVQSGMAKPRALESRNFEVAPGGP
jgi:hypothetical protein